MRSHNDAEAVHMKAMVLNKPGPAEKGPLNLENLEPRGIAKDELLVKVEACGVCRTDLHIVEGELKPARLPIVPGHEIVGKVVEAGPDAEGFDVGDRVGVPWLHSTCGKCEYCISGRENLCESKTFTGYTENGGYAEYAICKSAFSFELGKHADPEHIAPLLCAGIIGYRAFRTAMPRFGGRMAMFGFGSSAHLTLQLANALGFETSVVSRTEAHLRLAGSLGASETYSYAELAKSGEKFDGAIVFAPSGKVLLDALRSVKKGATVAVADIYASDIPEMNYSDYLFGEKRLVAIEANTRQDAVEYLELAGRLRIKQVVETLTVWKANEALLKVKNGATGSVVLTV